MAATCMLENETLDRPKRGQCCITPLGQEYLQKPEAIKEFVKSRVAERTRERQTESGEQSLTSESIQIIDSRCITASFGWPSCGVNRILWLCL